MHTCANDYLYVQHLLGLLALIEQKKQGPLESELWDATVQFFIANSAVLDAIGNFGGSNAVSKMPRDALLAIPAVKALMADSPNRPPSIPEEERPGQPDPRSR